MSELRIRADEVLAGDEVIGGCDPNTIYGVVLDPNQQAKYPDHYRLIGFTNGYGIAVEPGQLLLVQRPADEETR